MKRQNDPAYEGFDYESYDADARMGGSNEDIDIDDEMQEFTIVVIETVQKYVSVYTETLQGAVDMVTDMFKDGKIDMQHDIDKYNLQVEPYRG